MITKAMTIHFSNLDGTDEHTFRVQTDPQRKFILFSFRDGGKVMPIQPPDADWDICFTQYSTILFDDNGIATPYLVRGAFLNPDGTTAAADSVNSFYTTGINNFMIIPYHELRML